MTAQKIAQPASKTPVALSVPGGDELKEAGINEARALADSVPNVQIGQASGKLRTDSSLSRTTSAALPATEAAPRKHATKTLS